jgi:uncharacterized protein YjbJ (UPF0337 family)
MMENSLLKSRWDDLRPNIKQAFGRLTDDDIYRADGDEDKFRAALQRRYGWDRDRAEREMNGFLDTVYYSGDHLHAAND